ncbi:DUF5610 domain-containing protein [Alteromonas antoniana]|uniref:DUF5610 domain-containing protein n=1 Tax=Alteromonas antoniana TaxID=2803813 RepID=UPI001C43CBBC|nr:DUF5610 domain-containing protein [Alteromonas antoniana]
MNVGQIKAFLGDQKASVHPETALKKQLQEEGLRQAAEFKQSQSTAVSVSSSNTAIGLKIFSGSLSQAVKLDGKQAPEEKPDKAEDKNKSLFDFEKVARNVMRFVGGVIEGAARGGADQEKLNSLFSQAREGVAKGIAMAEKDIGSFMNDEIKEGIDRSRNLINDRIDSLEKRLLGGDDASAVNSVSASLVAGASDSRSGNILIRTRDGDELTLSFESLRQFQFAQQTQVTSSASQTTNNEGDNTGAGISETTSQTSLYQYFERSGISFSLNGELDEDEMKAIADLVGKANDLADTFFAGDMDKAFEEALALGFDDKELVGYALQLNHTKQSQVVEAYESIQHYRDDNADANKYGNVVSPISQYMDKMMDTMNSAGEKLQSGEDYSNLIAGIINKMEDVQVPDLLTAINRFHTFNQRLLDAMPGNEPVTAEPEPDKQENA